MDAAVKDGIRIDQGYVSSVNDTLNTIPLQGPREEYAVAGSEVELPVTRLSLGVHVYFDKPIDEDIYEEFENNFASLYFYKHGKTKFKSLLKT